MGGDVMDDIGGGGTSNFSNRFIYVLLLAVDLSQKSGLFVFAYVVQL